ncbi:MAG: Membrane-bound metal-dependent hydrolase YdjM, induced during SOS response, partial [uncultured Rubrobacteraceae bacterium]
ERHHARHIRGRGPGGLLSPRRGRAASVRLPRGRRGRLASGRGQPAQSARQRSEPDEEPYPEPPHPPRKLGLEGRVFHALSHRRAPDPDPFPARVDAFRRPGLARGYALSQPVHRPGRRLRIAPRRRRPEQEGRAAPVASRTVHEAPAPRHPVRRGGGVRGGSRGSRGGGVRDLRATPRRGVHRRRL